MLPRSLPRTIRTFFVQMYAATFSRRLSQMLLWGSLLAAFLVLITG